jgi:hypothetical protein
MSLWRRLVHWLCALAIGQVLSFFVPLRYDLDVLPSVSIVVGIVAGAPLVVVFERLARVQGEAFRAIVRGDRAACDALLAGRLAGGWRAAFDPFGSAALMVLAGSTDPARAHLAAQGPTIGLATRLKTAILAHADLVKADPARLLAALDVLLALPPFTVVLEREHYRARLIATAACRLAPDDRDRCTRALASLAGAPDPIVRAFACWPRAALDAPVDAGESPEETRAAAACAAAHGLPALAERLSSRAAAVERARAGVGPYRQ